MVIFEIVIPGSSLDYEDEGWAYEMKKHLLFLEQYFFQANVALNLFLEAPSVRPSIQTIDDWEHNLQRRSEIQRTVEQELGGFTSSATQEDIDFEVTIRLKREKWMHGRVPSDFQEQLQRIYARAFLYALDMFAKLLDIPVKEVNVPSQIETLRDQMLEDFPNLRAVRNSVQHLEDRSRGLGPGSKPLDLKPIENNMINAPAGGVLLLDSLNGSRYTCTMADGYCGEVDVSEESMKRLKAIFEGVLQSFRWRGPKQHLPGT